MDNMDIIKVISEVLRLSNHQRKYEYMNNGENNHSLTDRDIWYNGTHEHYLYLEDVKRLITIGSINLALFKVYNISKSLLTECIPDILDCDIDHIIDVKSVINDVIRIYKENSVSFIKSIEPLLSSLRIDINELDDNDRGNIFLTYDSVSTTLHESINWNSKMKTFHMYGNDPIPMDVKFEFSDTITAGYDQDSWLSHIMKIQKERSPDDNILRFNVYNVKDIFNSDYEYFIIAMTYKNTLIISKDEIYHPNIFARFNALQRNNRRVDNRYNELNFPYRDSNESQEISKIERGKHDSIEEMINHVTSKLNEKGYHGIESNVLKSKGELYSIYTFSQNGVNLAIGLCNVNDTFNRVSSVIYENASVSSYMKIQDLYKYEKLFFLMFVLSFRNLFSSFNGDYSNMTNGEFTSNQLQLESNNLKQLPNKEFEWTEYGDLSVDRIYDIKRYMNHAKRIYKELDTENGIIKLNNSTSIISDTKSDLRLTVDLKDFKCILPSINKKGSLEHQKRWLTLTKEQEYIQVAYNLLDKSMKSKNTGWSDKRMAYFQELNKLIWKHRESFMDYTFTKLKSREDNLYTFIKNGKDTKFRMSIVKSYEDSNSEMETWRSDILLTGESDHDYLWNRETARRHHRDSKFTSYYKDDRSFDYTRLRVNLYSAEQIVESLGLKSVKDLPLGWESFMVKNLRSYTGNPILDDVNPLTQIKLPSIYDYQITVGIIIEKGKCNELIKKYRNS